MSELPGDITRLLNETNGRGDNIAADVLPRVYQDLRRLAAGYLSRERTDHTLQPTALVHEAYLRLIHQDRVQWRNRNHFIGVAAQLMRRILVDYARARHADKRGGRDTCVTLDEDVSPAPNASVDLLDLDLALTRLATIDERQTRVVDLRYFGGLTLEETADALEISPATVKREWQMARAWLRRELRG